MEAIGAGASVLAFIGIGLTCSKTLYQTLSSYRDGSQHVQALAAAIKNLQTILTQLHSCEALRDPDADLQNMQSAIEACNKSLSRYQESLRKALPNTNATRVGQAWKRFTVVLDKKAFKQIWTEVNHHYQTLDYQLQLLLSNKIVASGRRVVEIGDALVEDNAHESRQSALLQQHISDLSIVHRDVKDLGASMGEDIQIVLESLKEKIEHSSQMSQQHNDTVYELLTAILVQRSTRSGKVPLRGGAQGSAERVSAEAAEMDFEDDDFNLVKVIQRISSLIEAKEGVVSNAEADAVIDELASLLENASKDRSLDQGYQSKRRRASLEHDDKSITEREMKLFRSLVTASRNVDVNTRRESASFPN
ncbi:MAG: hypothetical protein M1822_002930 [Bathelium mastoideum]|nr:MAG: hypothetical protein M1822_002930 [Bathelium mastoideum]